MNAVTVVQLTDLHLRAEGELVHGTVDTFATVRRTLSQLVAAGRPIDALVLSGDLADNGAPEAYQRLRAVVAPAAAALGAEIVYAMGNHDERVAFAAGLLDRTVDPETTIDHVMRVRGLRIIVLDSTVPGRHHGGLTGPQLDWLASELSAPAPRGTLLVLHHPPIPSPVAGPDLLRLHRPELLAEAVRGSDVQMIVCGHNHATAAGALAGVPVWIGPALAYRVDPFAPAGRHRGFAGSGFSRIDVMDSGTVATAVETTPAPSVYDRDEREVLDQLAALGAGRG
ncbi:metallophosphoesterase [Nocardia bhagyanarayanae]|uniref:3',5'-cyclic AMP phosphodiesterase CpdA n=1 Tax=Nocardia bhagyanarayanae TaxID=1215925 RepID=A0A543FE10_9NOCA|nr:metallophosphoesterase [Nocardia bhagyanarayanae]TQM31966.1 3',5'-cyclic AMP phosphodiesterase CpdA [Nocardia bhagyanarayanae]